jgi:hypothetical protein
MVGHPKLKLAHLLFGMSFEKSDRLVQAFRVDMFPRALTGFVRSGCILRASRSFTPFGFRLVILFHAPLPVIVAFHKSRQGRIGQVLTLSARECSNCGAARPPITPTTFVSAIGFLLRHAAVWFSGSRSITSSLPIWVDPVKGAGELADAGQIGVIDCRIGHFILSTGGLGEPSYLIRCRMFSKCSSRRGGLSRVCHAMRSNSTTPFSS